MPLAAPFSALVIEVAEIRVKGGELTSLVVSGYRPPDGGSAFEGGPAMTYPARDVAPLLSDADRAVILDIAARLQAALEAGA